MGRPNPIKSKFSALLRARLIEVYGRQPSAAFVAQEFNLRAYGCEPITQEAARRWLKGISMPEEKKLQILVNWLNLDISACFAVVKGKATPPSSSDRNSRNQLNTHKLVSLIAQLPQPEQELLKKLAKKLSHARRYA